MPAKWFRCPDGETIPIEHCLKLGGCRMAERCGTRPYLKMAGRNRPFNCKVTPSAAANGPLYMYLKGTVDYVVSPEGMVWASFGIGTHGKLSIHKYTQDVISEEQLSDEAMKGIPDVLDESEVEEGKFVLYDYKTWGSYKLAKALGIIKASKDEIVTDTQGRPVLLKSGPNKGKPKTHKVTWFIIKPEDVIKTGALFSEEMQLNRYRIFFEKAGFSIKEMYIQAIPRDGGTYIAEGRGITRNLYIIPIRFISNVQVLAHYERLQEELTHACETGGEARLCNTRECWSGRRCDGYCEVAEYCASKYNRPKGWKGEE